MKRSCKNCEHAYYVYGCEFACKYYDKGECNDRTLEHYERERNIATVVRGSKEVIPYKKYLIAYLSPYNDRVLTETINAPNQKKAIYDFGLRNANCDIIAITLMEE